MAHARCAASTTRAVLPMPPMPVTAEMRSGVPSSEEGPRRGSRRARSASRPMKPGERARRVVVATGTGPWTGPWPCGRFSALPSVRLAGDGPVEGSPSEVDVIAAVSGSAFVAA